MDKFRNFIEYPDVDEWNKLFRCNEKKKDCNYSQNELNLSINDGNNNISINGVTIRSKSITLKTSDEGVLINDTFIV